MSGIWSTAPHGNPHRNLCTLTGVAPDLELPTQPLDPLSHPHEPNARPGQPKIESPSIVGDLYLKRFVIRPQPHLDIARPGVTPYVREGLLQYAQQLYALLSRETYRDLLLDDQPYLALWCLLVQLHQRFDGLQERPLLLVPEVVYGAAQA